MNVYSYIFSKTYKLYITWGEKHPGVYSLAVVTTLQFLTLQGLVLLPERLNHKIVPFMGPRTLVFSVLLFLANYLLFYVLNKPESLNKRMEELSSSRNVLLSILSITHFVITVGLMVLLINL